MRVKSEVGNLTTETQRNGTEFTENREFSFPPCPLRFSESSVVVCSWSLIFALCSLPFALN
jgi:hypothetical protein